MNMNIENIKKIVLESGKTVFDFPTYFPEYGGKPEPWMKNLKFFLIDSPFQYPHPLSSSINIYRATFVMVNVNTEELSIRAKVLKSYTTLGNSSCKPDDIEYHNLSFLGKEGRDKLISYFEDKE